MCALLGKFISVLGHYYSRGTIADFSLVCDIIRHLKPDGSQSIVIIIL